MLTLLEQLTCENKLMFDFFKKIFSKKTEKPIKLDSYNYKTEIIELNVKNPSTIVSKNIDGRIISIHYIDIVRISIIVDGNEFLPQPIWTIQSKNDVIDIANDLKNANSLFFEILNNKLDGYNSNEVQEEILKAVTCTSDGFFQIWQRHDADKIFKSIE